MKNNFCKTSSYMRIISQILDLIDKIIDRNKIIRKLEIAL